MTEPQVLVVSGWAFSEPSFHPLCRALKRLGPVLAFEADPERLDDLRRWILAESASPRVILGWSLGGMLAAEALAATEVSSVGLVLVGCTARFCSAPGFPWGVDEPRVRAMGLGLRRDPVRTLSRFYRDCAAPLEPLISESSWDSPGLDRLARGLEYLAHRDLRAAVSRVRARCVVVHGQEDRVVPPDAGRWLAESIAGSRWIPVERLGHDVPLREPELLGEIVEELVRWTP